MSEIQSKQEAIKMLVDYKQKIRNVFKKFLFTVVNSDTPLFCQEVLDNIMKIADYWNDDKHILILTAFNDYNNSVSNSLYDKGHLDITGEGKDLIGCCWSEYIIHQHNMILLHRDIYEKKIFKV